MSFKPALPNPEDCPVYSASKDLDDYKMRSTSYSQDPQYSIFTSNNLFGASPGYRTTQGVVSVPATPSTALKHAGGSSMLLSTQWKEGQ